MKERFLSRVSVVPVTGCWVWTGGRFDSGYGAFCVGNKTRRAHRVAFELFTGPIPAGALVCHSCDNPPCVNPAHLRLGTAQSNMDEKVSRGRATRVRGHHKLTEAQVAEIKLRLGRGEIAARIASVYGVSSGTIRLIATGSIWRTVAAAEVE